MHLNRNSSGLPWQCWVVITGLILGGSLMIAFGINNSGDISRFNSTAVLASGTVSATEYVTPNWLALALERNQHLTRDVPIYIRRCIASVVTETTAIRFQFRFVENEKNCNAMPGRKVDVAYDPANPSNWIAGDSKSYEGPIVLASVGLILTVLGGVSIVCVWKGSRTREDPIEKLRQLGVDVRKLGYGYEVATEGRLRFFIQYQYGMEFYVLDARLIQHSFTAETFVYASKIGWFFRSSREWKVKSSNPEYASHLADRLAEVVDPKKMDINGIFVIEIDEYRQVPCWMFVWDSYEPNWTAEQWEHCVAIAECLLTTPIPISDFDDVSSGE